MNFFKRIGRGLLLSILGGTEDPECGCGHKKSQHNTDVDGDWWCEVCVYCLGFKRK